MTIAYYPIGQPGKAWGDVEKKQWFELQSIKRSYHEDVVIPLQSIAKDGLTLQEFGCLEYGFNQYSQFLLKNKKLAKDKPHVLITGGVHGYETSGVHGVIRFIQDYIHQYLDQYNFLIFPCISPWSYETINRWNPEAIDPNRSFYEESPAQECRSVMQVVKEYGQNILVHFDLHETTDTDATEFTPALAARDGKIIQRDIVPDGFYLVADRENYCPKFHKAIIDQVRTVTHIAKADQQGNILDVEVDQEGVIQYEARKLHLCSAMSQPQYSTTTEVYPDSPKVNAENCILAQVMAIIGGLEYLLKL
ncbi:MAG TPA: M14 family zinc carboxypeptidase [Oligoflexia bacterium]|nr:M14 family zinc carboxypeptidase [Oligoflexia bacterium]HMR24417.1 M14 family zinc carboxypeptidase [Oligoflexia bacterium]